FETTFAIRPFSVAYYIGLSPLLNCRWSAKMRKRWYVDALVKHFLQCRRTKVSSGNVCMRFYADIRYHLPFCRLSVGRTLPSYRAALLMTPRVRSASHFYFYNCTL